VFQVIFNLPPRRTSSYMTFDIQVIAKRLVDFANPLVFRLDFASLSPSLPLVSALQIFDIIGLFLSLVRRSIRPHHH
jgi:hypothetical protein